MSSREVASLALKLLGVYAIIHALPFLQYLGAIAALPRSERANVATAVWAYLAVLVPFLLVAAVAFILLTHSESIARMLVKEDREIAPGGPSMRDVQTIAFSIVGVLVFILAIPGIYQSILSLWYLGRGYYGGPSPERSQLYLKIATSAAGPVIQCTLGLVLFFRSRGLANFWHSLQSARYAKIDEGGPPEPTERKDE
jgi:hypothetical protein